MVTVVSVLADDFDSLARLALRQAKLAEMVELRMDRCGHPGEERLREFFQACPRPAIVTVHGREGFGDFAGSQDERLGLLHAAARAGAGFVDIDRDSSVELGEVEGRCSRIVSHHELDGTPADLAALEESVRRYCYENDLVKLVTHANCAEDGVRMLRHLRGAPGLIGFCSGEAGSFTRVLAPVFGSPFTYAAPMELPGEPAAPLTAPGQLRLNDLMAAWPPGGAGPGTAVFGVLGKPARHSWSPRLLGMALKAARLDAVYLALEADDVDAFIQLADDENFRGFSVTAPFKEDALKLVAHADDDCTQVRALNTLVREGAGWRGRNTDVAAMRDAIEHALTMHGRKSGRPTHLGDARVLILGAGGAARAAVRGVRGSVRTTVAARRLERAELVARELGVYAIDWNAIPNEEYDVLVHCTPAGSNSDPGTLVIPADWIRPDSLVFDAVYRPVRTPLLLAARKRKCTMVPGGEWFVRQAASQFHHFTGQEPDNALLRSTFHSLVEEDA